MKTLILKISGGTPNIHAIAFWITLVVSLVFFTVVLTTKTIY